MIVLIVVIRFSYLHSTNEKMGLLSMQDFKTSLESGSVVASTSYMNLLSSIHYLSGLVVEDARRRTECRFTEIDSLVDPEQIDTYEDELLSDLLDDRSHRVYGF